MDALKRFETEVRELTARAEAAEQRVAELERQLADAAERRQLDAVIASHRLTDTGWGRAS
jgi:hypothetical protein